MSGFILIFFDDSTELAERSSLSKPTRVERSQIARVTHPNQSSPQAVWFTFAGGGADSDTGTNLPQHQAITGHAIFYRAAVRMKVKPIEPSLNLYVYDDYGAEITEDQWNAIAIRLENEKRRERIARRLEP